MQGLSDNPAMGHVATGRVFDVQRQVWARVFHLLFLLRTLTFADMFAYYFLSFFFFPHLHFLTRECLTLSTHDIATTRWPPDAFLDMYVCMYVPMYLRVFP